MHECNCSMCRMVGFQHVIVPADRFRLLQGQEEITTYTFNTGVAKHTFCSQCGVKPFYTPRSNPDGFSVNLRCMFTSLKCVFERATLSQRCCHALIESTKELVVLIASLAIGLSKQAQVGRRKPPCWKLKT